MRFNSFASRNLKEMLRDRLNLAFGIGFPVVLLLLLTLIQANVPVEIFAIEHLSPGIAVFGLSFVSLFSGIMISKDRTSSFMMRLFASPLTAKDFILGYTMPLIPMAGAQIIVCFLVAFLLGLAVTANVLLAFFVLLPASVLYIAIGLLCGTLFNDKQVGGVCGALLTNVSAWLSGTWFDLELVGGPFQTLAELLPFCHAVNAGRFALAGEYGKILPELIWVIGYAAAMMALAIFVFMRKMKRDTQE